MNNSNVPPPPGEGRLDEAGRGEVDRCYRFSLPLDLKPFKTIEEVPCATCHKRFNKHYQTVAYVQRVFAGVRGLNWKRLSFQNRQLFKRMAEDFITMHKLHDLG